MSDSHLEFHDQNGSPMVIFDDKFEQFGPCKDDESAFKLTAFGLPEPEFPGKRVIWLIVSVGAILLVVFALRLRGQSKAT
jgi:hypothetical protein